MVFASKYRRKIFLSEKIRYTRNTKEIVPMERGGDHRGKSSPDHIHMYVGIPPKTSVAGFKGV